MSKVKIKPYNSHYRGLAVLVPEEKQNQVVLCQLERHTGML